MNTKRLYSLGVLAPSFLMGALALGCSASDNGPGGSGGSAGSGTSTASGGSSGSGGSVTPSATALTFDSGGFVAKSDMTKGIQGAFYAYGDGQGPTPGSMGTCQIAGHPTCSTITMTVDALGQKICAMGTAAMVPGTPPDYSGVFGAGVGFDLNNAGGDSGTGKLPYDAKTAGVTGVGFNLDTGNTYGGDFRIEFPAQGQDSIGANAPARYDSIPAGASSVSAEFADATVGYAVDGIAVSTNGVLSFQWHVATSTTAAVPFNFCLSNIHLLTQ
jgi:hypothetical protein